MAGLGQVRVRTKSVVVIDDMAELVDLTVLLLQSAGYRAAGSTDGYQATALVAGEEADVVVLDFMLNGLTGAEVCRALRAEPKTREVRIVLLSGTPEADIRDTCTQYDTYLRKPASGETLFRAIEG